MAAQKSKKKKKKAPPVQAAVPFWRKPAGWLAGVAGLVVSALVAFLVPQLTPGFLDSARDAAGSPVLGVTIEDDPSNLLGNTWSAPRDAGRPPVDANGQWTVYPDDWYRSHGALPAGASGHRIVVENRRSGPVDILDLQPVVLERRPALSGALYSFPEQGEITDVAVHVDLDETTPVMRELNGKAPYFAARHQQLAKGERVVFKVVAETGRCLCLWRVQVRYQDSDGPRTLSVPAGDAPPLQTTAYASSYQVVYDGLQAGYPSVDPVKFCAGKGSPCAR